MEARITRTCRHRGGAVAITLLLAFVAAPATAAETRQSVSAYLRARLAAADGDAASAAIGFAEALSERPDDGGLALRTYFQALIADDWALAIRAARRLQALAMDPPEAALLLAGEALVRGDVDTAQRLALPLRGGTLDFLAPSVEAWLATAAGTDPQAALASADGVLARGYAEAQAVQIAAASQQRDPVATARRGIAALLVAFARDVAGVESAVDLAALRLAARLDPADKAAPIAVAGRLAAIGETQAALHALDRLPRSARSLEADMVATALLLAEKRDADALHRAERAVRDHRSDSGAVAQLAEVQAAMGQDAAAAASFARALSLPSDAPRWRLLAGRGEALTRMGDWAGAAPLFEAALAEAPDAPLLLNNVGYALLERGGDLPRATAMIRRAAALAPDDPAIADSLGWALFLNGELDGAIVALERAAQGAPSDASISEHLGDAYWAAGRRREARFAWTAAIEGGVPSDALAAKLSRPPDMAGRGAR